MKFDLSDDLKKCVKMGDVAISIRMILFCGVAGVILSSGHVPQTFIMGGMVLIVICFIILGIVIPTINIELCRIVTCLEKGDVTKASEKLQLLAGRPVRAALVEELNALINELKK